MTRKCVVCGKEFELKRTSDSLKGQSITCSQGCATTLKFKNGNPFSDKSCREKASQTYMERTGYDHPMHNPEVVLKIKLKYRSRQCGEFHRYIELVVVLDRY